MPADERFDVVVVGASLGGCAAALRAAAMGARVCLLEATDWLGGQLTAQGVNKPDENPFVETAGSTHSYRALRDAIRRHYRSNYRLSARGAAQDPFNPGADYPGIATEPRAGSDILQGMLAEQPLVQLRLNTRVTAAVMNGPTIAALLCEHATGAPARLEAAYFLDATDLGELLPLCGAEGEDWVLGAESRDQTGEPDAPATPRRDWIQPITVPFALERRTSGEDHTITPPHDYERLKSLQRYTLMDGYISSMFVPGRDMWSYRQFIAASHFDDHAFPYDLTMMNTDANDYKGGAFPTGDAAEDERRLAEARRASLGFLYWLQTECPRDNEPGRFGYPELKLRADIFGTPDGTAAFPYIRESRRIKAMTTVVEQDICAEYQPAPRARLFRDSCGIGLYGLDVHALPAAGMTGLFKETRPYQIPLGALIPIRVTNLLAACKNLGVTHITNGAYRLHPIEWNIGEAAGALAAFCVSRRQTPRQVPGNEGLLLAFQRQLLAAGVPLFWWADLPADSPAFAGAHLLGARGILAGGDDLLFHPEAPLNPTEREALAPYTGPLPGATRREEACRLLAG